MKKLMQISFSGGRTSGFMTKWLLDNKKDEYNFIVTFANTGMEDERTLEFVNNCDKYFGFNTVWLEADVQHGERKGTKFKIVDYKSASRNGEPFQEVIKKYGIPNPAFPHCTRELKLAPMNSYLSSLGINLKTIPTAIGIRIDETRRVRKDAENVNIIYPLIDMIPTDKQDVLEWWSEQNFDLGIEEWDGNCKGCFKKSFKKIFKQLDRDSNILEFHKNMELKYGANGTNRDLGYKRVFFRGHTSAETLYTMWKDNQGDGSRLFLNPDENSGCSESCEVFTAE